MQKKANNLYAKYYQGYYWGIYQNLSKEEKEKKWQDGYKLNSFRKRKN